MAKRRRVQPGRVILLIVLFIAIAALCFFSVSFISDLLKEEDTVTEKDTVKDTEKKETVETLKIDLVDYECYESDVLDFNFAIVRIRLKDEKKVSYSLSNIKTSEGVVLSDTEKYIDQLKENNYYLSSKNVVYEIPGNEESVICSLFVPYTKEDLSLIFSNGTEISIDTKKNISDIETLKYTEGTFIESEDYEIFVSNAFAAGAVFEGDELVNVPSSQKVYVFELTVASIESGITLEEAQYVVSEDEKYDAKKNYTSAEAETNMFASTLEKGKTYGLFFKVLSADSAPVSYDGKLLLKFSNSDEIIEISAKFE